MGSPPEKGDGCDYTAVRTVVEYGVELEMKFPGNADSVLENSCKIAMPP
jgi:hypothetical protein